CLSSRRPPPRPTLFPYTTLFRSAGEEAAEPRDVRARRLGPVDRRRARCRGGGLTVARRTIAVNGETWEVRPTGRLTVYGRDQIGDRKSTRLNSSHVSISYAVFCL